MYESKQDNIINSHVLITQLQLMTNPVSFISYPLPPPKLFTIPKYITSSINISVSLNKDSFIKNKQTNITTPYCHA